MKCEIIMKIAIVSSRYPSHDNHYAHTFVHARARYLSEKGIDVTVLVPSKNREKYVFEGVQVETMPAYEIGNELSVFDVCYLHLLNIYADPRVNGAFIYNALIKNKIKTVFYLHGSEVQKYTTRMFDFKFTPREIARIIYKDFYFIPLMRVFVKKLIKDELIKFISPSLWMVKEAEANLNVDIQDYALIPNGIDIKRFKSKYRGIDSRKSMVVVRPLNSKKYAVDICIKTLVYLEDYTLDIYGKGPLLQEYKELATKLGVDQRVKFIDKFIPNKEMGSLFHKYGVYLSPTRMDAQGVSMCEAMATGMLVASSCNTAVPEFIVDGYNGILGSSPSEIADKIKSAVLDNDVYDDLAKQARSSMCSIDNSIVMCKELELFKSYLTNE